MLQSPFAASRRRRGRVKITDSFRPSRPYIVMTAASAVRPTGLTARLPSSRRTGPPYRAGSIWRARGTRRIVRGWVSHVGKTDRCAYVRDLRTATALAEHLNFMHQVQRGSRRVTLRSIDRQTNAELQRELIDAYGGLERYLADAGAKVVHEDETGRLVRREAGDEPIIAVQVVCPTTGRQYVLRVPPETKTAREGVAWTFGLPAALYQPTIQS